jgi:hypothetical protein
VSAREAVWFILVIIVIVVALLILHRNGVF